MNTKQLLNAFIVILLLVGTWGAGNLVLDEIQTGNGCPKIWKTPACLVILICFLASLVTHVVNKWNTVYFIFTGIALAIAIVASLLQVTGNAECPKLDSGTPMCYLSFLMFSTLIGLKIILIKISKP